VPVHKYRRVADMPHPPRVAEGNLAQRITALWQRSATMTPFRVVVGVQRFRSIEEANRAREEATLERLRQLRSTREG
jgi:hypothetical protein